ncbi:5'-nucleotidase [Pigmentiphaga soli]|uniref:5'-nucleotidase n=1 Tax=Pigmentiphaga soli TaxID=1007095 RepID=A0ABP8HQN5_9BURK
MTPTSSAAPAGAGLAPLIVAMSSRALFDLSEAHAVWEQSGDEEAYRRYQVERENQTLAPGVAFNLARKLLALNDDPDAPRVEIVLLSKNSADTGLRVFNSIRDHGLDIQRAAFTRGLNPFRYAEAFGACLFLSADPTDVREALEAGMAAATILPSAAAGAGSAGHELRIAFDGDSVLFSDESERIFQDQGLEAFIRNEREAADTPLAPGPFAPFLRALHAIQAAAPPGQPLVRTALVTARGAPSHERVVKTLRSWGVRVDESLFLGGRDKGRFLAAFGADIFFDDQARHCQSAAQHVSTGHVPFGIKNPTPTRFARPSRGGTGGPTEPDPPCPG